jgi:predicted PurR-regulated permease PerM
MWFKEKFFKYSVGIILVLVIAFLLGQLGFIVAPVMQFFGVLFFPLLISGFLYYLLRPIVGLVERLRVNRTIAIILVFLVVIGLFALVVIYAGSLISQEINKFSNDMPWIIQSVKDKARELVNNNNLNAELARVQDQLTSTVQSIIPKISRSIVGAVSTLTGIVTVLIMVPFILFFLLKDGHVFYKMFLGLIPGKYKEEASGILDETDKTLSVYIIGQAIIAVILGLLMYIGYLIIGMDYALILALFALVTSFIPMFGTIIGVIPAFIVGLAIEPFMVVKILIVVIIVNQLEGNLISPFVVGKRLEIHPLTLILLFLVSVSFFGFIGMLIAVPVYAVLKVLAKNFIKLYRLQKGKPVITKE